MKCNLLLTWRKPPCNLYPAYWSMRKNKAKGRREKVEKGASFLKRYLFLTSAFCLLTSPSYASSGTEGAAFLDIPVGAGPASLGGAYSALADDAYAPTYNPGALGFVESNQFAAQHLSYLESIHYEYLSFVHPLHKGSSMGGSIQYLGTGDMAATDNS